MTPAQAWKASAFRRERQGLLLICAYGLLVPLSALLDAILEPPQFRSFLCVRLADLVFSMWVCAAIVRARDLRAMRRVGAFGVVVTGAAIGFICARVSPAHYFPYVLGFSLVFWCHSTIHTWPLRYSLFVWGLLLGVFLVEQQFFGLRRSFADLLAAYFYVGSTAVICVASVENRRRLHRHAFFADHALDARNQDLAATVRSLRETQTRLVEGEKLSALGRLIASLSHEIHNPVNVLQMNLQPLRGHLRRLTEGLQRARRGDSIAPGWTPADVGLWLDDSLDAIGLMEQGIRRIQTVHQEMRAFVRGDAPETLAGDLNEGLRATAGMFRRSLARGISIELRCGALPPTLFQPGQMNQVFFNLLQNAVDAIEGAGAPGAITVSSDVELEWVRIMVEDTGPGVSELAKQHLFEPFFTTKAAGKGTGLGLATSYQIIHRHQGRIELDESCTSGARFVVRLPRASV